MAHKINLIIALWWSSLILPFQAVEANGSNAGGDSIPGMEVAVRQTLFDYGVTVGVDALSSHIHDITIHKVETTISVPFVGDVDLTITDIKCLHFKEPRQLARVEIENTTFSASSKAVSANFKYSWTWKSHSLPLDGAGDGSIEFDSGDVAMNFSVVDSGGPQIIVHDANIHFEDIEVHAHGSLSWLYNALLALFHDQIVTRIEGRMNEALMRDVPAKLNSYLSALPSTVVIQGLPISAAFQYGIYTHGFLMVRAYPTVGAELELGSRPRPPFTHEHAAPAAGSSDPQGQAGTAAVRAQQRREAVATADTAERAELPGVLGAEIEPVRRTGGVALALLHAAWQQWQPWLQPGDAEGALRSTAAAEGAVADGGQKCPSSSVPLNVSDAEIATDSHMATLFMNDAVPQCLLWALHRRRLLHYTVKDGEVPGVRLLTDVFAVLIPGVQKDYPHRSIALSINATSEPQVEFLPGEGARIAGSYETRVWVLPEGYDADAGAGVGDGPAGAVEVAVLEAQLSGVVDLQFKRSHVADLQVKYEVKESKYTISAWAWEATVKYVVGQAEVRVGVEVLWDKFVAHGVASKVHAQHALGRYLPGWFQLAVDFQVDLD